MSSFHVVIEPQDVTTKYGKKVISAEKWFGVLACNAECLCKDLGIRMTSTDSDLRRISKREHALLGGQADAIEGLDEFLKALRKNLKVEML